MGILSILKGKGNILYYPGCLSKYVLKAETANYIKILNEIGIDFIMLPDELCCGSPVFNAGYEKEAIKLARKNLELFKKHNITRIITNCPACFKTFNEYKDMLPDWKIKVEHITKIILDYIIKKKIYFQIKEKASYHDPCHLGRHSGIYDEPREILSRLGYEIVEMKNNRENALCCGGGAGLKANNPELADKIARERIKQAKEINVNKIITTCPLCFSHMDENAKDIEIVEFSYVIADALGLKPEKTTREKIIEEEKKVEAFS